VPSKRSPASPKAPFCLTGNCGGNLLTTRDPTGAGSAWNEVNGGGSVQITGTACPTAARCIAVDNNGAVLASTQPALGAWSRSTLTPYTAPEPGRPPLNALLAADCPRLASALSAAAGAASSPARIHLKLLRQAVAPLALVPAAVDHSVRERSSGKQMAFTTSSVVAGTSTPAFASTRVARCAASNASATTSRTAAATHRCATGSHSGFTTSGCEPSASPAFAAVPRRFISAP
jgi:hypothetical protein